MIEADLVVRYAQQGLLRDVYESARVVSESYDEEGTRLRVRGLPDHAQLVLQQIKQRRDSGDTRMQQFNAHFCWLISWILLIRRPK